MLPAPRIKYKTDPSLSSPLTASGCFSLFFFPPSYQLSREKHSAADRKGFHTVSLWQRGAPAPSGDSRALCCVPQSQHSPTADLSLSKPVPHRQDGTCTGHFLTKLLRWCSLLGVFCCCCVLGRAEQLSHLTKDHKAETSCEKYSLSTGVFFYRWAIQN